MPNDFGIDACDGPIVDGLYYDWGCERCRNHSHACGFKVAATEQAKAPAAGEEPLIIGMKVVATPDPYATYLSKQEQTSRVTLKDGSTATTTAKDAISGVALELRDATVFVPLRPAQMRLVLVEHLAR